MKRYALFIIVELFLLLSVVYPINWAFVDGRISEDLYKEEHELAYDQIRESEQRENEIVTPSPLTPVMPQIELDDE